MADQLKISQAPVKMPSIVRHEPQAEVPFQIQDVSRVNNLNVRKEEHGQNLSLLGHDNAVLSELFKNSALTTQYIFAYQNIASVVQMLAVDNAGLQEALGKLLTSFALESANLVQEMKTQAQSNGTFYGQVFDELRNMLQEGQKHVVIDALQSMLLPITHARARKSIQSHLQFLMEQFSQSEIQGNVQKLLEMSPQMDANTLQEALAELYAMIAKSGLLDAKTQTTFRLFEVHLSRLMRADLKQVDVKQQAIFQSAMAENLRSGSKIMDKFVELLHLAEQNSFGLDKQNLQDIVRFILNAPSNYIPLQHLYLPLRLHEQIVHAEVWIAAGDEVKATHVLLIVDLNDIGMVECEIHALDKRLSIQFNVPGAFRPMIESLRDNLMQAVRKLGYGIDRVHVVEKTQTRSLLDVFPHLQALQTGIDTYA